MKFLSIAILLLTTATITQAQQLCNGYAEFCSKQYQTLTYLMTHNSYSYIANPAANQACPVNIQLDDGVRGLKLSAIKMTNSSSIQLCHTSCTILNAGPAVDTLSTITNWLKANPNEVITIMWNNLGSFGTDAFKTAYTNSGLIDYVYTQPFENFTWPTLGELIASGKRVINFIDEGANSKELPWLMREWDFVFETPYNNRNESSFECIIDRPNPPENPTKVMYVMNHFLYGTLTLGSTTIEIPQKGTSDVTNGDGSLLKQAEQCTHVFGRQPNFLEVDFYNNGDALQITAQLNNVTYHEKQLQCNVYESTASTSSTTTGGSISEATSNIMVSLTAAPILLSLVAVMFSAFL
ncbi:PLC-like phosphodiesterase [Cokeromyces recurvatus]|uniref:PLC-like phosphodiesterase n=1 Tax=Cokeromyces recurvatus TaxID=90255 RepID=UPI00221F168D|nr:PLC-like phosphodiesterase [Cokeromyces recurvatus]KAI7905807.1 PLC-like phosphodiesterase [Cokeromyces recurvatus]